MIVRKENNKTTNGNVRIIIMFTLNVKKKNNKLAAMLIYELPYAYLRIV